MNMWLENRLSIRTAQSIFGQNKSHWGIHNILVLDSGNWAQRMSYLKKFQTFTYELEHYSLRCRILEKPDSFALGKG